MDNLILRMDKFLKQLQNRQLAIAKDPCLIVDGKDERKLSHYRGIFFSSLTPFLWGKFSYFAKCKFYILKYSTFVENISLL